MQPETEGAAAAPALVGEAVAADLLGTAAFAEGVHARNARRVDDAGHGRSGQDDSEPVLMGREEATEPGACGEARKKGRESRVTQRWNARFPTPLRAGSPPRGPTARGQWCAAGRVGMV